jgi:hypothetical protein
MTGCISQILAGVVAAIVGALIAMMFQAQIVRYFSPDRLVADVYAGPWEPIPKLVTDDNADVDFSGLKQYATKDVAKLSNLNSAKIIISNPGAKVVQNIRISTGEFPPSRIAVSKGGAITNVVANGNDLSLGQLAPGESVQLNFWSPVDLSSYYFSDWKTFSSEGPMVMHLHTYQDSFLNNDTEDLVGTIIGWVFGIGVAAFSILLIILAAIQNVYINQLMTDEDWYLSERGRHDSAPKKFHLKLKS